MLGIRRLFFLLSLMSAFALPVSSGVNRWTTTGPYGGYGQGLPPIIFHPADHNIVYFPGGLKFYRSFNSGRSWETLDLPGPLEIYRVHPSQPDRLIAAAVPIGSSSMYVFESLDRGSTWRDIALFPLEPSNFYASLYDFEIDPFDPLILYASITHIGFFKSLDGGKTWQRKPMGLPPPEEFYGSFVLSPTDPKIGYLLISNIVTRKIKSYKTTDGGESWRLSSGFVLGTGNPAVAIDPFNANVVYSGSKKLFKSMDGGKNWFSLSCGCQYIEQVIVDPQEPKNLWIKSDDKRILKSVDAGKTWKEIRFPFPLYSPRIAIHPLEKNVVFVVSKDILRSEDGGSHWLVVNSGIKNRSISTIQVIAGKESPTIFALASGDLFQNDNTINPWKAVKRFATFPCCLIIHPKNPNLMAVFIPQADLSLGLTKDGGRNWKYLSAPSANSNFEFHPQEQNTIYASVGRSTDFGKTWELFDLPVNETPYGIAVNPTNGSILYVFLNKGILKSTDAGASWASMPGAKNISAIELKTLDHNPRIMYVGAYQGVFKSVDGGKSWTLKDKNWPNGANANAVFIDRHNSNRIYAVADEAKLYFSTNGADTWQAFDTTGLETGNEIFQINEINQFDANTILIGTNHGVYSYTIQSTGQD